MKQKPLRPESLSDSELLRRARHDPDAFSFLAEQAAPELERYLLRLTRHEADAADLLQETLLSAWRHMDEFRGDCRFFSWLCRIGLNKYRDLCRRRKIHPWVSLTGDGKGDDGIPAEWDIPDESLRSSPEAAAESAETAAAVRSAIDSLSEEHRTVILLRDVDGLSYREIAEALGLEIGTVKSRISRGRDELKKHLAERNLLP